MPTTDLDRLRAAIAAWNAGDLDGYLSLYAEDIRLHGYSPEPMGKAEVAGFYRAIFDALTAQGRFAPELELHETLADGDQVACRFTMRGEQRGEFLGVPPTGLPFELAGITILRFRDGAAVERWSTADFLGMLQQLGALPVPA